LQRFARTSSPILLFRLQFFHIVFDAPRLPYAFLETFSAGDIIPRDKSIINRWGAGCGIPNKQRYITGVPQGLHPLSRGLHCVPATSSHVLSLNFRVKISDSTPMIDVYIPSHCMKGVFHCPPTNDACGAIRLYSCVGERGEGLSNRGIFYRQQSLKAVNSPPIFAGKGPGLV
jgi:hypothetical protein